MRDISSREALRHRPFSAVSSGRRRGGSSSGSVGVGLHLSQRGSLEQADQPGAPQTDQALGGAGQGESFWGPQPQPSAKWGSGTPRERLPCTRGVSRKDPAPRGGRSRPLGGSRERVTRPTAWRGPEGSAGAGLHGGGGFPRRGGGRGGSGITWAEASPGAPGGSPKSWAGGSGGGSGSAGVSSPSLPSWTQPPSPTGERGPAERAHLRTVHAAGGVPARPRL